MWKEEHKSHKNAMKSKANTPTPKNSRNFLNKTTTTTASAREKGRAERTKNISDLLYFPQYSI